jgi:hypothetical protein
MITFVFLKFDDNTRNNIKIHFRLGRGVFAGSFIPSGNIVEDPITLRLPVNLPSWQMDNYYW